MADCLPSTEFHLSIPHWERESHLPVVQETTGKGSSRAARTLSGPTLDCAFGRYLTLLTAQALPNTVPTWQDGQRHTSAHSRLSLLWVSPLGGLWHPVSLWAVLWAAAALCIWTLCSAFIKVGKLDRCWADLSEGTRISHTAPSLTVTL